MQSPEYPSYSPDEFLTFLISEMSIWEQEFSRIPRFYTGVQ